MVTADWCMCMESRTAVVAAPTPRSPTHLLAFHSQQDCDRTRFVSKAHAWSMFDQQRRAPNQMVRICLLTQGFLPHVAASRCVAEPDTIS